MPPWDAIKRADLVPALRRAGFDGPDAGAKHQIMRRGQITVILPNLHQGDISVILLARILRRARISRQEWESL